MAFLHLSNQILTQYIKKNHVNLIHMSRLNQGHTTTVIQKVTIHKHGEKRNKK